MNQDKPMLRIPSFQKWLPFVFVMSFSQAQPMQKSMAVAPHFTIHDAIQAEWMRAAPNLEVDALPKADRERFRLTLQRIGAPGMPTLLPPELENPTVEIWEAKAKEAKTPQARFTALHCLNRLKSPNALTALDGVSPEDAKTWPKHLYLDANIATARLQGGEISKELKCFLDAMKKEGKVEPVRAQAARLRLVMAGKEKELLPLVAPTPGSTLSLLDAWGKAPWKQRQSDHRGLIHPNEKATYWKHLGLSKSPWRGFQDGDLVGFTSDDSAIGITARLCELCGSVLDRMSQQWISEQVREGTNSTNRLISLAALNAAKSSTLFTDHEVFPERRQHQLIGSKDSIFLAGLLPALRVGNMDLANKLRDICLNGISAIARSAALEDLPEAPADLDTLTQLTWKDRDLEPQQTLIESYSRWKLPKEKQIELLKPWLQHPDWACRHLAYQQLVKLDVSTPWPIAPEPNEHERTLLKEAERLASSGKPLRLRLTFSGKRQVTLRLDPTIAPINVANLAMLARKGFFNGRLVPRVVPDFVVQLGSPHDTMDGGPGYTVRCENSLTWYGPGSVGMALSGKDTGGSQFFITTNATPHLIGRYTRLGEVENLDRALKILDDLELGAKIERMEVLK